MSFISLPIYPPPFRKEKAKKGNFPPVRKNLRWELTLYLVIILYWDIFVRDGLAHRQCQRFLSSRPGFKTSDRCKGIELKKSPTENLLIKMCWVSLRLEQEFLKHLGLFSKASMLAQVVNVVAQGPGSSPAESRLLPFRRMSLFMSLERANPGL